MKPKVRIFIIILLIIVLLLGCGMMAYPYISAKYSESVRSEVQTQYQELIQESGEERINEILEVAHEYNRKFYAGQIDLLDPAAYGYFDQLKIEGSEVMGYIRIPKIGVELPIYHGIGEDALGRGCGHMPQSSLPVGGENTHAVISAHTGMAESPMFTDLELLEPGDIFQIEVLGQVLTYEVEADGIQVVLPEDITSIQLEQGRDLVTLVTCTPFGVNTHRLLVRGSRILTPEEETEEVTAITTENEESVWEQQYQQSILTGLMIVGVFILLIIFILIIRYCKERKRYTHEQ